jgi:hypothetical protein
MFSDIYERDKMGIRDNIPPFPLDSWRDEK